MELRHLPGRVSRPVAFMATSIASASPNSPACARFTRWRFPRKCFYWPGRALAAADTPMAAWLRKRCARVPEPVDSHLGVDAVRFGCGDPTFVGGAGEQLADAFVKKRPGLV